jgi:hypothetical protein
MNKKLYIFLAIALYYPVITPKSTKQPLKKIKSFLTRNKPEKIEQQELSTLNIDSIAIHNINGDVTIKTGWKKNSLYLKTTKHAKKQTDLDNLKVIVDPSKENHLVIATKQIDKKITGSVEYELIVPASLNVSLSIAGNGQALVKDINGNINVVANDTITITNTRNNVSAQTLKKGSILIANACGPVSAITQQGNIIADSIAHNFSAYSSTGKVTVAYTKLPSTSSVDVETASGNIFLTLPSDTNAEIRGHTAYGTVVSDHYITLKPYATQLNSMAWNKYRKEVNGVLGSGEATIALRSAKGNVRIIETKII